MTKFGRVGKLRTEEGRGRAGGKAEEAESLHGTHRTKVLKYAT